MAAQFLSTTLHTMRQVRYISLLESRAIGENDHIHYTLYSTSFLLTRAWFTESFTFGFFFFIYLAHIIVHCPKINLNLCIKTEPITTGAYATVYICQIFSPRWTKVPNLHHFRWNLKHKQNEQKRRYCSPFLFWLTVKSQGCLVVKFERKREKSSSAARLQIYQVVSIWLWWVENFF